MGGKQGKAYVDSWKKNPLENAATGGMVSAYKGATAGTKAPTSTSLGIPSLLPKASKVDGFQMPTNLKDAEMQMIQRQALIASGQGNSIAQMAMNKNMDQITNQNLAFAASQRGSSDPALAFRQAQIMNQQAGLEAGQSGAMMAEQERRQADQMIAAQAASQRGVALQQAMSNQAASNAQRAQNMQLIGGLAGTAGMMAMGGGGAAAGAVPVGATGLSPDAAGGTTGYSRAYMASDENAKENIKPKENASGDIEAFMNALKPYMYNYKNEKHGSGEKMGVMAQDLEKSEVGKTMVDQAPDGTKMVDTNKAIGAVLAAVADINRKLKKLEK